MPMEAGQALGSLEKLGEGREGICGYEGLEIAGWHVMLVGNGGEESFGEKRRKIFFLCREKRCSVACR